MKITSTAFGHNGKIPSKYTCDGEKINPPLEFADIPEGTKSLVLIVDDPDAPMGNFVHWIVYDIKPTISSVEENSVPGEALEGENGLGEPKYVPPCPPSGTHHYIFQLFALDIKSLNFEIMPNRDEVFKAMEGHILDRSEIIGLYERVIRS